MMQGPSFVRRPHESNDDLVVSYCSGCNAMVGAAASHLILKLMESEHVCKHEKAHAAAAPARKPKSSPVKNNPAA